MEIENSTDFPMKFIFKAPWNFISVSAIKRISKEYDKKYIISEDKTCFVSTVVIKPHQIEKFNPIFFAMKLTKEAINSERETCFIKTGDNEGSFCICKFPYKKKYKYINISCKTFINRIKIHATNNDCVDEYITPPFNFGGISLPPKPEIFNLSSPIFLKKKNQYTHDQDADFGYATSPEL